MKKLSLLIVCGILSICISYSQPVYHAERLLTDLNGAASNERYVLCYGNYGIIMFSEDRGQSWKQTNIGDDENIRKIQFNGEFFYGISGKSLIKGDGSPKNWQKLRLTQELVDFEFYDGDIALLTENELLFYTKNFQFIRKAELVSNKKFTQLELHGGKFIILQETYSNLIEYDDISRTSKELIPAINNIAYNKPIEHIKEEDGKLFLVMRLNHKEQSLLSYDGGEFRIVLTKSPIFNNTFSSIDDEYHILYMAPYKSYFYPSYMKIIDSVNVEMLNSTDTLSIENGISANSSIFAIHYINADTIFAFGTSKMIWASYNRGKNWKNISAGYQSMKEVNSFSGQILMPDENRFLWINDSQTPYFISSNNGTIWKSIRNSIVQHGANGVWPDGKVLNCATYSDGLNYSKDFGSKFDNRKYYILSSKFVLGENIIKHNGNFIINCLNQEDFFSFDTLKTCLVYLDEDANLVDSVYFTSFMLRNLLIDPINNDLISLGAFIIPYRNSRSYYTYNYGIFRSTTGGKKWVLEKPLWYKDSIDIISFPPVSIHNEIMILQHYSYWKNSIYYYDLKTKRLDSAEKKFRNKYYYNFMQYAGNTFLWDNKIWFLANLKLYYSELNSTNFLFDSLNLIELLPGLNFDSTVSIIDVFGQHVYFNINIQKGGESVFGIKYYESNIVKLSKVDEVSVEEKNEIKLLEAYPNPASDFISIQAPIAEGKVEYEVYTLSGEKALIGSSDFGRNIISIDIKTLKSEIYFLKLKCGEQYFNSVFTISR